MSQLSQLSSLKSQLFHISGLESQISHIPAPICQVSSLLSLNSYISALRSQISATSSLSSHIKSISHSMCPSIPGMHFSIFFSMDTVQFVSLTFQANVTLLGSPNLSVTGLWAGKVRKCVFGQNAKWPPEIWFGLKKCWSRNKRFSNL